MLIYEILLIDKIIYFISDYWFYINTYHFVIDNLNIENLKSTTIFKKETTVIRWQVDPVIPYKVNTKTTSSTISPG